MENQMVTTIKAGASIAVEAQQTLDLKGGLQMRLNNGTKPLATVGSVVQVPKQPNGQVVSGSPTIWAN